MIYADQRRIGDHGIGRFARHVLAALDYRPIALSTDPDSPFDPWRLTRALSKLSDKDIFFSPGYNPPLSCAAPFVLTLHDLNHLDRPENSSLLKRLYYATVVKRACLSSSRILTVSAFSRARIIAWSGVPAEKVVNVGCGVGPEFHPAAGPSTLPFPYLLCVSNRRGHKNEFRTVEAFARASLDPRIRLVFTGEPTGGLTELIARNHVANRVHFAGLVADAQLPSLYGGAEALVFVSLYEGFGLPVLEAMACGTPVVTSNSSALPEVAGEAAVLVDPTSTQQIAAAMERIVGDAPLRNRLIEMGLQQAARFTWDNTILAVRDVLRKVSQG